MTAPVSRSIGRAIMQDARAAAAVRGVVIVGAGQAGGRAAETLRSEGFAGAVTLLGDEAERPYERPSLSKEMLLDPSRETIAWLHDPDFYEAQDIRLLSGATVDRIDRVRREVVTVDGTHIGYGALILATGADARRLAVPSGDADCCYIRSLADSRALRHQFAAGARVVVVGAGFIGLEVAAAAVARGCDVTVVELGDAPLGRVAPPVIREYFRVLHERRGVRFRFGAQVVDVVRSGGTQQVRTDAGELLDADVVVVGIGATPRAGLAGTAGLQCDRGIVVDEFGQTSDPLIFAAGDVARHFNPLLQRHVLLESWQNAQNQAITIARNLARVDEEPRPYAEWPWFWSDQYDANLQIYGLPNPGATSLVRGDPGARSWLMVEIEDERILFGAGINAARDLRPVRELMKLRAPVDPALFTDPGIPLTDILRSARSAASGFEQELSG